MLVDVEGEYNDELLDNLCMHITANAPAYIAPADVPAEIIAHEKEIATARLDVARHLLSTTEQSVTRIATLSGFSSVAYFMQSFSAAFGMAPGVWRQHHGGTP